MSDFLEGPTNTDPLFIRQHHSDDLRFADGNPGEKPVLFVDGERGPSPEAAVRLPAALF